MGPGRGGQGSSRTVRASIAGRPPAELVLVASSSFDSHEKAPPPLREVENCLVGPSAGLDRHPAPRDDLRVHWISANILATLLVFLVI